MFGRHKDEEKELFYETGLNGTVEEFCAANIHIAIKLANIERVFL
jgi:hypothetical protein